MLMKGLGMREIDRYIKDEQKGRNYSGKYNRPKFFSHNGINYPLPPELYNDKPYHIHDYEDYGVTQKYLDEPGRSSEGLAKNPLTRQFEHDRSQWPRQGFTSPFKDVRGRALRDEGEFKLWCYWHPHRERIEEIMDDEFDEGYNREYNHIGGNRRQRSRPPGIIRNAHRKVSLEPHRQRRDLAIYNRPSHRQHGSIDIRDPKNRPPYPTSGINSIQIGTADLPSSIHQRARGRHPQRYPAGIRVPGSRDTNHPPHPAYGIRGGYGEPPGRLSPHIMDNRRHRLRGRRPLMCDDDYEIQDEGRPEFVYPGIHRHPALHRHHPFTTDDEDEEDTHSHHSTRSYQRHRRGLSPRIVYSSLPPYYGRHLGHSRRTDPHEFVIDAEDEDDNELLRRSGRYVRPGRGHYGIGSERERGCVRVGRRGYDGDDLDYEFSGDEGEFF